MRRLFAVTALAALFAGCTNNPAPEKKDAMASAADSLHYAYKATYSSAFTMGDPANAKIVLDIWKAYETNKLGDTKSLWADSVTMEFSDGFFLHTSRDSLIAGGEDGKVERISASGAAYGMAATLYPRGSVTQDARSHWRVSQVDDPNPVGIIIPRASPLSRACLGHVRPRGGA